MWLKARHDENPYGTIATISRYTAHGCPLGLYCKTMGISIWNAPKWAQKVREFYAEKMHGMQYSAMDAVYHMVELYGYKCSAIFRGDEEEAGYVSTRKAPKAKQASVCVAPAKRR
jgi:hypothetical protein